jgi:phosphoribosylaminoimidazole-succinocarboxamide synthase
MYVHQVDIVPVECVVRGYLAGSGWKEYQQSGTVCGVPLPDGLQNSSKLPEPIFTPTTKAAEGHDMPMTYEEVEQAIGKELAHQLRSKSLEIYSAGAAYAAERGILLADTKFEFGMRNGVLTLADEVLTPDSSRYWDAATYEPGRSQDSFDKQIVRDWLETTDWNKEPPPPTLPAEIIEKASARYQEIADRLMA